MASRKVTIFSLGGTITSARGPQELSSGAVPLLKMADIVNDVPLPSRTEIDVSEYLAKASQDLTFGDIVTLARRVREAMNAGAQGIVIAQGTDTIEETSMAFSLLTDDLGPVAFTGAMRHPNSAGADGLANLKDSIAVVTDSDSQELGCVVVMDGTVFDPMFVRKEHTTSLSPMRSSTGAIGWVAENRFIKLARKKQIPDMHLDPIGPTPNVGLWSVSLGDDGRLLRALDQLGYHGLVVEAMGGGHVPASAAPLLKRLAQRIPIVLASRTGGGALLTSTYGGEGSEIDLLDHGLISSGVLDARKSRVALTLLLQSGVSGEGIRSYFTMI